MRKLILFIFQWKAKHYLDNYSFCSCWYCDFVNGEGAT